MGNGGFGPGYGLIGCAGGFRDARGETIVEAYRGRRQRDPEDPAWSWPEKMVPLFSWGGAVYTCGDFGFENCPLSEFDPYRYQGEDPMTSSFRTHGFTLGQFLFRWINGHEIMLDS